MTRPHVAFSRIADAERERVIGLGIETFSGRAVADMTPEEYAAVRPKLLEAAERERFYNLIPDRESPPYFEKRKAVAEKRRAEEAAHRVMARSREVSPRRKAAVRSADIVRQLLDPETSHELADDLITELGDIRLLPDGTSTAER
jgi:hypothetical protein